jgi:hypothetical protein
MGEVPQAGHEERSSMKKLKRFMWKTVPYVFNGFFIYSMLEGTIEFHRASQFLMWFFGIGNFFLGAMLMAWYKEIATYTVDNRETKNLGSWFKPTNATPYCLGLATAVLAAAVGWTGTAVVYGLGLSAVYLGICAIKHEIRDIDDS